MPGASGVFRDVALKAETTYGTLAGASGAQLLRRVSLDFNLKKNTYESNEVNNTLQTVDLRHGTRSVQGKLDGELSPGSYALIMQAIFKRDFAAVSAITGLSITVAAGAGSTYTLTRGSGSWLTSGVKVGNIARLTAGTFNASNLNKNLVILAATSTVLTVMTLNGSAMVAEGPIASATLTVQGKKTFVPTSGHTDKSFTMEDFFGDITQSEVGVGVKFNSMSVELPPTGLATVSFGFAGKDMGQYGTSRYFSSPAALSTSGLTAAVNGIVSVGGSAQGALTGMQFTVTPAFDSPETIGSNTNPYQFAGRVRVSGQFTAIFEDGTLRDNLVNETEIGITTAHSSNNTATSDFIAFGMSRIKVTGADKNDGEGGIIRTYPFTALLDTAGGASVATENSTIWVQDSLAP